jgi:segregation and condensation protein B
MNDQYVRNVIEAALLAAGRPLASDELVTLFDERDGSNPEEVQTAIDTLRAEYETRGLELVEVASGYRIQIRGSVAQPVSRLWQERPTKYSRALLETLALVAYRQPITRGEIEQIRGVAVNPNIIKTLQERGWVRVVGHRDVPGRPELLGTTRDFLDYFNLKKLDDLPTLAQLKELDELRVQLSLPGADPIADGEFAPQGEAEVAIDAVVTEAMAVQTTEVETAEVESAVTEAVASGEERTEVDGAAESAAIVVEAHEDPSEGDDVAAQVAAAEPTDTEGTEFGEEDDELDAAGQQHRPHGMVARGPEDDQD